MSTETARPIAVIGMACRYPGASNLLELWENILAGRQQFREIPDVRLPLSEYHDPNPSAPDKTYGRKAAVIDGFQFDSGAYRIPKSTCEGTDIAHWLALVTALEALNHARIDVEQLPRDTAGAIIGNTLTGEEARANTMRLRWPFVRKVLRRAATARGLSEATTQDVETAMEAIYKSVFPPATEDTLAGGLANTIAGRICNYLDWHGGGYVVDGACSSSLLAIATAADYLQQNKMDLAIAGGVDVSLDAFELIGFSKATALTRDEMRVYDRRGSGFIPGEGCGMVVLKRLEDARRDGNTVYAVLRGWGVSSDGRGGITAPSAKGQSRALIRAYQAAGYAPQSLTFIEGHGTGTVVGDRTELEGIAGTLAAFGPAEDHQIGVTSFKSIVGHTKAAAGVGGFIKAVIAVNRRIVPPTAGCTEPHTSFADAARSLYPVLEGEIRAPEEQLRAGISAMGFGGINCHVTVESGDPPASHLSPSLPERLLLASRQQTEVIPLSAENLPDLIDAVQALRQGVTGLADAELIDLAARCAQELKSLPWRAAVVASSTDELQIRLEALGKCLLETPPEPGELWRGDQVWVGHAVRAGRVGFLFPGQGSQQIGMTRGLVKRFDWARDFIAQSDAVVARIRATHGRPADGERLSTLFLRRVERDPAKQLEPGWMEALTSTENAQPAICIASWMWMKRLESVGIEPQVVGGHSLGELTALAAAGAYDAVALVRLAALRGAIMSSSQGADAGIMGVLHCDAEQARTIVNRAGGGYCAIANINSPLQTVISGEVEAVRRAVDLATTEGLRAGVLPVSNAFHSLLVESAAGTFRHSDRIPQTANKLTRRLFSSIDGREIGAGIDLRDHLANQIVSPVDFTRMVEAMSDHCDWFVEVGPGRVLSGLVQSHDASRVRPCFPVEGRPNRDADFHAVVAEAFTRGLDLRWEGLHENRLVRPFIPASERRFYVNPCERELAAVSVAAQAPLPGLDQFLEPTNGMTTLPDLATVSETLISSLCDAVRAEHATVLLFDEADNALHVVAPTRAVAARIPGDTGIFGDVVHSGAAEAIEVLAEEPRFQGDLEGLGVATNCTALYVPIGTAEAGRPAGVVRVARSLGAPFTRMDAEIVTDLANGAAPALIQAHLYQRFSELHRIHQLLRDVVASGVGDRTPHATLSHLLESARASLGAEHASMLIYDRKAHELYSLLANSTPNSGGVTLQQTGTIRFSADSGIAGHVFRTLEPLHIANACRDSRFNSETDRLTGTRTRSIDCVPLLTMQREPLGVLLLVNRKFPADRQWLADLGLRAGTLLAHQPLIDQLRETQEHLKAAIGTHHPPATRPEASVANVPAAVPSEPETIASARAVLLSLISQQTGFAVDTLHDEARLIDDLNLDSIKIGGLLADAALQLGVQGKVDPVRLSGANIGTVIAAFEEVRETSEGKASAMDALLDLVVERTGFDRQCLSREQRLLDDLNIDSIKAGSLLGDLLLRTQTQGRLEAVPLAGATLGEIADQVQRAMDGPPRNDPASTFKVEPHPRARWIRSFIASRAQAPLSTIQSPATRASDQVLLLVPGGASSRLDRSLAQRLGARPVIGQELAAETLPEKPRVLVMVLSDSERWRPGTPALTAVDELAVLHNLARRAPEIWQGLRTIVFVQRTGGRDRLEAAGPSASSFAASLYLERPELEIGVIDFDPALQADFVANRVATEISGQPRYNAVEYDAEGVRWTRCMRPVQPEDCMPRSLQWSRHDVFLVTGGGKGITAECALALARETGVKLALIGRSPAPRSSGEESELASTLRRFTAAGIEFRYYTADVADRVALERAVAAVRRELGAITGVLHGAGANIPRPLIDVSAEAAKREIAPKLQGAENLVALFEDAPPKLFAALTSVIGVTGMRNNAWYAYSNEAVARLLAGFSKAHPETTVVSYAFSVWDEVGMGVKLGSVRHLSQLGIDAIPVVEGVRQFLRWMRTAPPSQEVIVAGSANGLATWVRPPMVPAAAPPRRFDGEQQRFEPGVELVTRVKLDTKVDVYLADHNYRNSLLFPTVMGLEAMAETCLRLSGKPGIEVVRIEDIQLERPIVVDPRRPTTIEIRALAFERALASDPIIVEASIHSEQTGFDPAHFAARFVLGRRPDAEQDFHSPAARELLDIVPSVDLYGGVLFQGPLFQRISAIESLDEDHVVFTTEAHAETMTAPEGIAEEVRASLVLGDPYYRDTLLQAAQLSLTPDVCLPIRIGRIDMYAKSTTEGRYRAEARILRREGPRVMVAVEVLDAGGALIERISDYEVRVLERRPDFPTPADLVGHGNTSEQRQFQAELDEHSGKFGCAAPSMVIRRIPNLQSKRRKDRHSIARPVFHAALRQAGHRFALTTGQLDVDWLESGKPVVVARGGTALGGSEGFGNNLHSPTPKVPLEVSLSHDDEMVLCVAGIGPQGCDLVVPIHRNHEQWKAMLGERLFRLVTRLASDGESLNQAGARVWSALESAVKATNTHDLTLEIDGRSDTTVMFRVRSRHHHLRVLTYPVRLSGAERMIAVVVGPPAEYDKVVRLTPHHGGTARSLSGRGARGNQTASARANERRMSSGNADTGWLSTVSDPPNFFGVRVDLANPNALERIVYRFPLAFKDGANPDGTLYFVRFFEWMGRLREMALRPILAQLASEFASGERAWVTNRSWAQIERPVHAGDVVEVSTRFLGRTGPENSMVAVGFEWHRVMEDGALERIATTQIQMTWAKVISHGVVAPAPYPPYLDRFFQDFAGATDDPAEGSAAGYRAALERIGDSVWRAQRGPAAGIVLDEKDFSTSSNDANVVGNVYYSKYYELQGVVRDSYFHRVIPEAYQATGKRGGIRCIYTEVQHLRDAMPFDTVRARMHVIAVHERGFQLGFDFFRITPEGKHEKLATGTHVAAWITAQADAEGQDAMPLPRSLHDHLLARIGREVPIAA